MREVIIVDEAMPLGALTRFQDRLLTALGAQSAVTLDLSRLAQLDLGFVQLVTAARDYAKSLGISFALAAPAPAPVTAVLRRAGFLSDSTTDDAAFWLHGAQQ